MLRLLALPLAGLAAMAAQSLHYRHFALRQQTADSVTVVASWTARNADSVRIAYANGITRTRGPRGRDSVRVARPSAPATFGVTLTPLRGSVAGAARALSLALPVRPQPAPSIDSASVDTATTAPVVPPPPPSPPTAFTPNLPAGMRLVVETEFDRPTVPGLEVINWGGHTVQSPTTHGAAVMTVEGRSVMRTWFPERHAGNGTGPLTITTQDLNSRSLYMAVRMRYSANYEFHTNTEKLFYPITANPQSGMSLVNVGRNGELVGLTTPFEIGGPIEPLTGPGVVPIGRWFLAEFFVRMNSAGQPDGTWQVWIDGVLVVNRSAHQFFRSASAPVMGRGRLDFTRGGGTSGVLTPLGGQWVDVDRLAFYAGT